MDGLRSALLAPPLACFVVAALGLLLWKRRPKLARVLIVLGCGSLVLACEPFVAGFLLRGLQSYPALTPERYDARCGAIVVLAGDVASEAPEYGGPTCGPMTLERLRYAAFLARETDLPLLLAGGVPRKGMPPHAAMMKLALERDFGVQVRWMESRSANTRENVRDSIGILRVDGVERAYVVTHAWHMPRAIAEFERSGFAAVAAPTGFRAPSTFELSSFTPNAKALRDSAWAMHEWIGRVWYAVSG